MRVGHVFSANPLLCPHRQSPKLVHEERLLINA